MTPRVALVHDALLTTGGAERVFWWMHEVLPQSPMFAAAYRPDLTYPEFRAVNVRTTWLQPLARNQQAIKLMFPLAITAFRTLHLPPVDVVLSSSTYAAKAVRIPRGARHLCYCYVPFRLAWTPEQYGIARLPSVLRGVSRPLLRALRSWDRRTMSRVDDVATTCENMRRAIKRCYGRDARVIHPPIRCADYPAAGPDGDYYLVVSRLVHYKRVDLAIQACNRLRRPLVVVGDGPTRPLLERLAGPSIRFVGRVNDAEVKAYYAGCRALLFPGEEDFGLTPLEAQACGRPVIAFGRGGALETVKADETGVFFGEQTESALVDAILRFERLTLSPVDARRQASRFDVGVFRQQLLAFIAGEASTEGAGDQ